MIDIDLIMKQAKEHELQRAKSMPTEKDAFAQIAQAVKRLEELGWSDAVYCPKDGSFFDAIEAGCYEKQTCSYMGEWPKGGWWSHDEEDSWPSRPIMYKLRDNDDT